MSPRLKDTRGAAESDRLVRASNGSGGSTETDNPAGLSFRKRSHSSANWGLCELFDRETLGRAATAFGPWPLCSPDVELRPAPGTLLTGGGIFILLGWIEELAHARNDSANGLLSSRGENSRALRGAGTQLYQGLARDPKVAGAMPF
jgi:hypothetical protein